MFIIRFIFYVIITYFIMKILKVFVDPMLSSKSVGSQKTNKPVTPHSPSKDAKQAPLGEYVEYEEVK